MAAELGIRAPLLYRWAKQLRLAAQQGGQPELKTAGRVRELEARIRQLSEENAKLLEQREVLKNRWASSPKRRREVCPSRVDERPI